MTLVTFPYVTFLPYTLVVWVRDFMAAAGAISEKIHRVTFSRVLEFLRARTFLSPYAHTCVDQPRIICSACAWAQDLDRLTQDFEHALSH